MVAITEFLQHSQGNWMISWLFLQSPWGLLHSIYRMDVFLTGYPIHVTLTPLKMAASLRSITIKIIIQSPAMLEKSTLTTHNPSTLLTYVPLISMNHNSHVPLLRRHIHSESLTTDSLMQAGTQWHLLLTSAPNNVNVNDPPLIPQWLAHILTICIMWVWV